MVSIWCQLRSYWDHIAHALGLDVIKYDLAKLFARVQTTIQSWTPSTLSYLSYLSYPPSSSCYEVRCETMGHHRSGQSSIMASGLNPVDESRFDHSSWTFLFLRSSISWYHDMFWHLTSINNIFNPHSAIFKFFCQVLGQDLYGGNALVFQTPSGGKVACGCPPLDGNFGWKLWMVWKSGNFDQSWWRQRLAQGSHQMTRPFSTPPSQCWERHGLQVRWMIHHGWTWLNLFLEPRKK